MVLGGEVLADWPGPPANANLEQLQAYAEVRFLAELLHGDIEFYIGPGNKLWSTWNRAERLRMRLVEQRGRLIEGEEKRMPRPTEPITLESARIAKAALERFGQGLLTELAGRSGDDPPPIEVSVPAASALADTIAVIT